MKKALAFATLAVGTIFVAPFSTSTVLSMARQLGIIATNPDVPLRGGTPESGDGNPVPAPTPV